MSYGREQSCPAAQTRHSNVQSTSTKAHGEDVAVICESGFHISNQNHGSYTCLDGKGVPPLPLCIMTKKCPFPEKPVNGLVSSTGLQGGSKAFLCLSQRICPLMDERTQMHERNLGRKCPQLFGKTLHKASKNSKWTYLTFPWDKRCAVENYDNIPVLDYIVDERLENIRCSVDEVGKLLLNLKVEKSPGPDNIPARILKVCATELAPSISLLLNKSFSMGMLPIEWKTANITPIFKKGSKNSRENYRQISLTGIICKIGEKVVRSRVLDFWYRMNILSENQFAYLKGKSTVTQLLSTVDDWVRSRNSGVPTDVIFLDLAKAFDSVPHERLILKLR
ncbi:Hypothetical predicted protein, partial [Paramuricea clavata]